MLSYLSCVAQLVTQTRQSLFFGLKYSKCGCKL